MNSMSLILHKSSLKSLPFLLPPPSVVPLGLGVKSDQTLRSNFVPNPEQLRDIHIERTVWLGAGKQLVYRGHGCRYCVCGRPGALQEVEADFARLKVYIRVADWRYKADGGRREGICIGDVDVEEPAATCRFVRYGFTATRVCAAAQVKGTSMYLHMPFPPRPS